MEMGHDQYGLSDLRHLLAGRTHFPTFSQPQEHHFPPHHTLTTNDLLMLGSQVVDHVGFSDSTTTSTTTPSLTNTTTPPPPPPTTTTTTTTTTTHCPFELDGCTGVEGGNGRWPRQETLTLLEIRSHLDSKFKEANQKGPLWDEVSRIMAEEHGYQRSGKKCREKFENLYKYYKKTKEGKAGRQDGKHYRFFRQLEALYGETSNPSTHFAGTHPRSYQTTTNHHNPEALQGQKVTESLSISNSCFDTSSSEEEEDVNELNDMENNSLEKKKKMVMNDGQYSKRGKKSWKCKIRDFVDSQMRKLMETQETWLEKMLKMIEQKERERMSREEEWRKREAARIDQEHKFWANERAWFEARDAALMEALRKITGKEPKASTSTEELMGTELQENIDNNGSETLESTVNSTDKWPESEISSLIHLRTCLESRFHGSEYSYETLWVEIASKMACLGYDRNAKSCEEKWQDINKYLSRSNECTKKRKENLRTSTRYVHFDSSYNQGGDFFGHGINQLGIHLSNERPSPSNSNAPESCFPFLIAEGENLWENYGMKINRGENH